MSSITRPTGWLTYRRKISFSFRRSAVRFFGLGTKWVRHFPLRLRTRRYSNPRKPNLSPCNRSTFRLFSSLISTLSLANSSRSRFSTAPINQSCLGWESINTTRSRVKEWLSDFRWRLSVSAGFPFCSASLATSWPVHHSLPIPPDVQFSRVRRSDSLRPTACADSHSYLMTPLPM